METDPPAHYFHLPHENDLYIISPLLALIVLILPYTEAVVLRAQRAITAEHTPFNCRTHPFFGLVHLLPLHHKLKKVKVHMPTSVSSVSLSASARMWLQDD